MPAKIMGILAIVIKKVAEQASKIVLLGALVGGVSMMSYATGTTAGPTIEKAQLETVHINLEAVVAAITKTDPDWVKGLPMLRERTTAMQTQLFWYEVANGRTVGPAIDYLTKADMISDGDCKNQTAVICLYGSTEEDLDDFPIGSPPADQTITTSLH